MVKKAKKAKWASAKKWKPKTIKKRPLTQREMSIAARLDDLGVTHQATEKMREITLEIDRKFGAGPKLKLANRITAARTAFEDGILNSNSIKECIAAARKAADL